MVAVGVVTVLVALTGAATAWPGLGKTADGAWSFGRIRVYVNGLESSILKPSTISSTLRQAVNTASDSGGGGGGGGKTFCL